MTYLINNIIKIIMPIALLFLFDFDSVFLCVFIPIKISLLSEQIRAFTASSVDLVQHNSSQLPLK